MNELFEHVFDLGEGLRAVWRHDDGTRCPGLYPGVLREGLWFQCAVCSDEPQRVTLDRIRPMIG